MIARYIYIYKSDGVDQIYGKSGENFQGCDASTRIKVVGSQSEGNTKRLLSAATMKT